MTADISAAQALLSDLISKVQSGDVEGGKTTLAKLKIAMLDFPPTSAPHTLIAISALEQGVLLSVADDGDMESFARNVAQVKPYYESPSSTSTTATSPERHERKCHITGLNLMHLLVENRLSEFHAELELLTNDEASHKYVSYPITLERQLMVGSYDEVLKATTPSSDAIPDHNSYEYFVVSLLQTVRDNIADCLEVAYKSMTLDAARSMMRFDSIDELLEYMKECRDDWIVNTDDGEICFQPPVGGSKASDVPSMKLIAQSLSYATELERIV